MCHSEESPLGLVDVSRSPAGSTAAHRFEVGHETEEMASGDQGFLWIRIGPENANRPAELRAELRQWCEDRIAARAGRRRPPALRALQWSRGERGSRRRFLP